jgi:hypothetical protein
MSRFHKLANFLKKITHEVPTGPHTDVRRRKLNPSFKKKLTGIGKNPLVPTLPKLPKGLGDKLKKIKG